MKINKNIKKIIQKLVDLSFQNGKLVESQVTKSIKVLKSLPKSQAIEALTDYLKGLKIMQRQHTMVVETVIPLSPSQINRIRKIVEKKIKITKVLNQINPHILGGFKFKVGDEVWDESILGKVNQIKETILSGRSD